MGLSLQPKTTSRAYFYALCGKNLCYFEIKLKNDFFFLWRQYPAKDLLMDHREPRDKKETQKISYMDRGENVYFSSLHYFCLTHFLFQVDWFKIENFHSNLKNFLKFLPFSPHFSNFMWFHWFLWIFFFWFVSSFFEKILVWWKVLTMGHNRTFKVYFWAIFEQNRTMNILGII